MNANSFRGHHYIAGQWLQGQGEAFVSTNPVNGKILWQGNKAVAAEVNNAFNAAETALAGWAASSVQQRTQYLQDFARQISKQSNELAHLISMETGKPLWEALTEVNSVISKIPLSISACQERNAQKQTQTAEAKAMLRYKPHGVVAVYGAFNFPAHLSNGHITPALLAGNTVIYKPSELTPAVAEFIMQCWNNCGLPQGVLNCVQGDASTGKLLLDTPVKGVYFTGSYQTGKNIHQHFSGRPEVILALEMGGNNPLLIDEISNLDAAVYQTILSTFISSGQRCTCARRVLIKDDAQGDALLNRLIAASKKLQVAAFTRQPEPFMGSVISHKHALAHLEAQQALLQSGGNSLLSMSLLEENTGLLSPGIIDMSKVDKPEDKEIFAPLIQVWRYQDFEQALVLANQTAYGLVAGLLSDNAAHYEKFYQTIKAGLINWNRPTTGASGNLPFGGIGHSGNHRPSAWFAADYCSYPVASMETPLLTKPAQLLPGIILD